MAAQETISTQEVLEFLGKRNTAAQLDPTRLAQQRAYRHAAAVLAGIRDVHDLKPAGGADPSGAGSQLIEHDLVPISNRRLDGSKMIAAEIRRQALSELKTRGAMLDALRANPQERTGPVQAQLENYIKGDAKPITDQNLFDLQDSLQALLWLDGILDGLPDLGDVRRRLDFLRLLAPLEALAGDSVFRGRQRELNALRNYIGVLPPSSISSRIDAAAAYLFSAVQQPALSVFGPGGVGKSALVARFMLEHNRLPETDRIPFAILDFDRPTLDISNPLTLCLEMIRQVHLQFPMYANFTRLHEFVLEQATKDFSSVAQNADIDQLARKARSALADLLGGMQRNLGPRPYVVTLDTFEEVQYRGEAKAFPFWDLLSFLQTTWPFLRVVVSGRAPVKSLQLAGKPPFELEIGDLDRTAAIAFLQAQGVAEPDLAEKIVGQVGGVPLSLKLAASLLARERGGDVKGIRGLKGKSSYLFSVSDEMIQGQLFERILGHIHNSKVERLAHPGLVMRRITTEVIFNVLNIPCNLAVGSLDEAQELFDELRKETALVTINQDDAAEELVHRPDLRRIMLKLLIQKAPAQVNEIHKRAVEWYSQGRRRLRSRAEELYHRLQLREQVDKAAFDDPEIRFSLQTSIAELPLESQQQLASYGFHVSKEVLDRASRGQRELHEVARVEELLPYGPTSVGEAARVIVSLITEVDGPSPLYLAAARIAFQQEDPDRGLDLIEQGLSLSIPSNDTLQTLDLLREKAWAVRHTDDEEPVLDQLNDYALRHQKNAAVVQHRAQFYAAKRRQFGQAKADWQQSAERDARLALIELLRFLPNLTALEIWGLVPTFRLVLVPRLLQDGIEKRTYEDVVRFLGAKVAEENGPFSLARFADTKIDVQLRRLVNVASKSSDGRATDAMGGFITQYEALCSIWPYHVLGVQPPYGRGSQRLFEAV